ncbi:DNA mismatch repair protein Mlh1 [Malassezia sp. CBS 17886]|nr:DNA mismatch repair protein Mlh1 [Malassezia sp. CBS 17886]
MGGGDEGGAAVARAHIARLDEEVVNRIAAGEIIQRPCNALKELLENSLDAGATQINITLQDGGMKLLQIQDNGHGIQAADLPLLCERFATSKLRTYEDLAAMTTFGFRGEALASISFVSASVAVVSKTRDERCAFRAIYFAGALRAPDRQTNPQPCAGTDGTTVSATDLFFNAPQRRKVFKSPSEEYNRCVDVASKYAVHFGGRGVGISCKKAGAHSLDLSTPGVPGQSTLDAVRTVYGSKLARELVHLAPMRDEALRFSAEAWASNANWESRKSTIICFINHRLVEVPSLKRAVETMYATVLARGRHPWMYVSLELDPSRVDVNVHPTKQEVRVREGGLTRQVHFLDEDEIVEKITAAVEQLLAANSTCRVYSLPAPGGAGGITVSEKEVQVTAAPRAQERYDPRHLVRTDHSEQSLDGMMRHMDTATLPAASTRISESACELTSMAELRAALVRSGDPLRTDVIQHHTFVGVVDEGASLSLLQRGTQLYLVNHAALIEAFAYQLALRQFGAYVPVKLAPAPRLRDLIALGYDAQDAPAEKAALRLSRDEVVDRIVRLLLPRSDMLREYFAVDLDATQETVEAIPVLLPQHSAFALALERLPEFFFRLGPQVDWDDEKACFDGIMRELAWAHVPGSCGVQRGQDDTAQGGGDATTSDVAEAWVIQHVWFASMLGSRAQMIVPKQLPDTDFVQVASLPDLYRVFERC